MAKKRKVKMRLGTGERKESLPEQEAVLKAALPGSVSGSTPFSNFLKRRRDERRRLGFALYWRSV